MEPLMGRKPAPKPGRGTRGESVASWERARPAIQRLYVQENKPLPEVMEAMAKSGFYGS